MFGTDSFPAWRIAQPSSEASNSLVKRRGNGVGEGAGVRVGSGGNVAGIGEGRGVEVGNREGAGVAVALWQAVRRMRHPIRRSFFIMFYITQMSGALFQTIVCRSGLNT